MKKEEYFREYGVIFLLHKSKKRAELRRNIRNSQLGSSCYQIFNVLIFIKQYMNILNILNFELNFHTNKTYHCKYLENSKQSVQFFTLLSSLRTQSEMFKGLINILNILR